MTNINGTGRQPNIDQSQVSQKIQNTKEQISNVVNSVLSLIPNDATAKREINEIAKELYKYADDNAGAVGKEGFTKLLKKLTPENVVGVIMKYNQTVSPDESIVEMMLDEVSSAHEDIREALVGQGDGKNKLRGLFTVLLDRAKAVGMDDNTMKSYRRQFEEQLDKELRGAAFLRSSEKMDEIITTVIQSIKNHIEENNKAAKEETKPVVKAKTHEKKALETIKTRTQKARADFNTQMDKDELPEDIADAMGRLWGKNYADAVRKDLDIADSEVKRLETALAKGDEAFRNEFSKIFGVTYDTTNITAYQNAEKTYIAAAVAKNNEEAFKSTFSTLLSKQPLREETTSQMSPTTGVAYLHTSATKEQVFNREFNKLAELFQSAIDANPKNYRMTRTKFFHADQRIQLGQKSQTTPTQESYIPTGKEYLEKLFAAKGATTIESKYNVLKEIAKDTAAKLTKARQTACGGRSFDSIQKQYDNCYKAAYGLENDILKRVTDYNISQQQGGGAVKGAIVALAAIGIGILTAGTGTAAVGGATAAGGGAAAGTATGITAGTVAVGALKSGAIVAGLSAGVEVISNFTSKEAFDALKNDGVLSFLEKGWDNTDWKQVATTSLVNGAMCVAFAGQSYAITNLTMKVAVGAGMGAEAAGYTAAALSSFANAGTMLGTEYVLTGEISVQGVAFTVVMTAVSGVLQVTQVYKSARAADAAQQTQLMENVANARKALGFGEDEVINLDKAEQAYKAIAKMHHPNSGNRIGDGAMHDAIFASAQNAIEILRKNPTLINSGIVPQVTTPQTTAPQAAPTPQQAGVTGATVSSETGIVPVSHYNTNHFTTGAYVYPASAAASLIVNGVDVNGTIKAANSNIISTETEFVGEATVVNGKNANGQVVSCTIDNGTLKSVQHIDGQNIVTQIFVNDKVIANYVTKGAGDNGVYTDANGNTITESMYNRLVKDAVSGQTDPVNAPVETPAAQAAATEVALTPAQAPAQAEYVPIVPLENSYSNTEIINIYNKVENTNDLINEYNNTKGTEYPIRKAILEDIIEQRTGLDIDEALAAAKNGNLPAQAGDSQGAVTIPLNPQSEVTGIAASSAGTPASPSVVTGAAAPVKQPKIETQVTQIIENAKANVVTTTTETNHDVVTTYGKDANGKTVTTVIKNNVLESTVYIDGNIAVQEFKTGGKLIGSYITEGGEKGIYINAKGEVISEEAFGKATTQAVTEAYEKLPASQKQQYTPPEIKVTSFEASDEVLASPKENPKTKLPQVDEKTQQAINDGLIRQEYVLDVENALANSNTQNVVRNTMLRAKTQAELQYFADKFKNSNSTANRYTALKAEAYKDQLPVKPSEETLGMATGQGLLPEGEAATSLGKETPISVPEGTTVEKAKARIADLQKELKAYGAGTDRYDQIHMDRIQAEIKAYREIAPLDRTNLEEVLQASPDEVFQPVKADNIKGQGISFKPYVPEDPVELAKVTYKAVPLYTEARTVEEMIRIAARDGVKIEMVQDSNGNYFPGVKSVWSEGAYFKLDRDSYVVQYGEIPADDPYVDQAWAEQNKYVNAEGKEVIMDCAIVAADKKTAADIMPHSYVKASGAQLSPSDKHNWGGFQAHKDPNGVVNAVAYDEPQELQTLEGTITTDVTMGDVEGNVYNKYNDLKKQIVKGKLIANPDDPNSQKFIDLVKAGKDDEAIALLREATKTSQAAPTAALTEQQAYEASINKLIDEIEIVTYRQSSRPEKPNEANYGFLGPREYLIDMHDYYNYSPKTYLRYIHNGKTELFTYDGHVTEAQMKRLVAEKIYEQTHQTEPTPPSEPNSGQPVVAKQEYVAPETTITSYSMDGDLLASDGSSSSLGLWSRFKKAIGLGDKSSDNVSEVTVTSSSVASAQAAPAINNVSPMQADTGIKPFGGISFEEAMPQIEKFAKENGLTISHKDGLFGDTYELTNAQGQKVRIVVFDKGKVDIEWNRKYDTNGNLTNDTMYDAKGEVIEATDYKYDAKGKITASIKVKSGYDDVGVFEYNSNGRVVKDYYTSVEKAEAKFGKISHTEILKQAETPAQPAPEVAKPNTSTTSSPLGESLTNPSFPTKFDTTAFKAWADANGLTIEIKDGVALFSDKDGNLVRRITNNWEHKGQVYDDHVLFYFGKEEAAKLIKYADEQNVRFYYNFNGERYASRAELHPDGLWYDYNTGEQLRSNPVTGEPQVANNGLQVHEAKPSPVSFEGAAVPETTLSGSYVKPAASTETFKVMPNSVTKCEIPVNMPRRSAVIGNVSVTVAGGDMTGIKADAYVVPEFNDCASEGGVGGAVARRGGAGGLKAYQQHVDQNGALEFGDVVVTESGGGKTSHLIHAVTAGADANSSFEVVQRAVYNSLKAAQKQGMQSVVVPAMGTGIIGTLTNEQSAQAILAGVNQFAQEGGKMDVSIVVYSTGQGLQDFNNTLTSKSYENAKPVVGSKEFDEGAFVAEFAQTLAEAPVSSSDAPAAEVKTQEPTPAAENTTKTDGTAVKKKPYAAPEVTEASLEMDGDLLASDGSSSSLGLWSRFKKAIGLGGNKSLDDVLEAARKKGAEVKEIAPGEYEVTQNSTIKQGKLVNVPSTEEKFDIQEVSVYKDGNPEPVDFIRYKKSYGEDNPVVQRTMREGDEITHFIIDRGTGYGVSYSGYDAQGHKIPGQEQVIRIIDKNNKVLQEYTSEDIENALLVPTRDETSRHAAYLLDIDTALDERGIYSRILEWQADSGTRHLVSNGKSYKPENFTWPVSPEKIKEYTDVTFETPAFGEKAAEYNEYARTRNLTMTEGRTSYGKNIQFKDAKGNVVRSITANKTETEIKTDEFFQINSSGEVEQTAVKDGNGKLLKRTLTEYRQWWGKACHVEIDYEQGKAYTGLYFKNELTQPKTLTLEEGLSRFREIAGFMR